MGGWRSSERLLDPQSFIILKKAKDDRKNTTMLEGKFNRLGPAYIKIDAIGWVSDIFPSSDSWANNSSNIKFCNHCHQFSFFLPSVTIGGEGSDMGLRGNREVTEIVLIMLIGVIIIGSS